MITVNGDWVIDVDDRNYIVCRNKPNLDKDKNPVVRKDGNYSYDALAFFGTLQGAIEFIMKQSATDKLITTNTDLKGAISTIRATQEEIAEIIKQAIPDAKTYFV